MPAFFMRSFHYLSEMTKPSIILMGISGSGKTTIGRLLADHLQVPFLDADDYHSEHSKQKMGNGIPLDDTDRMPWLLTLRSLIEENERIVMACSALRQSYRQLLDPQNQLIWIFLTGDPELIRYRMSQRNGHFMKENMIASQLEILEKPENALLIDVHGTPAELVAMILTHIQ